jgi:protein SCO1/2
VSARRAPAVFVAAQRSRLFLPVAAAALRERKDGRAAARHSGGMTTTRLAMVLVGVVTLAVAAARGRGAQTPDPSVQTFAVTGTVVAPPEGGRVMVAHHEIPGYMAAMTMPFALSPDQRHPALRPGDVVRFTLRVGPTTALAADVAVTGRDGRVADALAAPAAPAARRLRVGDRVPDFSLVGHRGEPFTSARLRGRRTAVTFIFTRCPVPEFCPLMIQRFQEVQRAIAADPAMGDAQLIGVTIDPAHDSPAVLDAYATARNVDAARWQLLTGPADQVGLLTRAFAVHVERNGVLIDHTLATAVIDAEGRVTGLWRGNRWTAAEVVEGLKQAGRPTT